LAESVNNLSTMGCAKLPPSPSSVPGAVNGCVVVVVVVAGVDAPDNPASTVTGAPTASNRSPTTETALMAL
jgi:hypothetical protein